MPPIGAAAASTSKPHLSPGKAMSKTPTETRAAHIRQYTLFALPEGFALPEDGEAFESFAVFAAERFNRGGLVPIVRPEGEGCATIAFSHAGRKDRPVLAFDRDVAHRYSLFYPPLNCELMYVDEPHRLLYVSPYHPSYEGILADILLSLCGPNRGLRRLPLDLNGLRTLPPHLLRPAGRGYSWNTVGLRGVTVRGVGRNPVTAVMTWEADAFDAFLCGECAREGTLLAASLRLWPAFSPRIHTVDLSNHPKTGGGRVRAAIDPTVLPVLGEFLRASGLLEEVPE